MRILVLNSGSSSQKIHLYELGDTLPENPPVPAWEGKIEWDSGHADVEIQNSKGVQIRDRIEAESRKQATEKLLDRMWSGRRRVIGEASEIDIVGHRVVNGGKEYEQPTFVTPGVRDAIERMEVFTPLHNRSAVEDIAIVENKFRSVPQVAVFDTAFHSHMPDASSVYPGPYDWLAQGIRRFGFHGINHQYCAERVAQLTGEHLRSLRLVTCHLGGGCSLAAIRDGRSVDTTMGFTPVEGLMMGTRSGSVDPGILTYLMRERHLNGDQIDELLNKKSGLLGISGISGDMRQVELARKRGDSRAALAFDIFIHRLRSGIGAMIAVLGGIDALVFTAGIGENSAAVRAAGCANFEFLGVKLDPVKNGQPPADREISQPDSAVRIFIVCAQEEWAIARDCWRLAREKGIGRARAS
jgi:acetate kinase